MVVTIASITQKKARELLTANTKTFTLNNKEYHHILPSREYYTHQWFWDSCTHAMGLAFYDMQQAQDELTTLLAGQWKNGFIGHITYNSRDHSYFPNQELWGTSRFASNGIVSSGLIQPPLLAIAVEHMGSLADSKNDSFITSLLPAIIRYHDYLKRERDPENSGLISIIHPWESGTDNSPRWDKLLQRITLSQISPSIKNLVDTNRKDTAKGHSKNRPQIEDYYRYIFLIDVYKSHNWDMKKIISTSPFVVKDVLVNSIWAKANNALANLLEKYNQQQKAHMYRTYAEQTTSALHASWSKKENAYANYDCSSHELRPYYTDTIANFLPLYPHAATQEQLAHLLLSLQNHRTYASPFPVPSVAINNSQFEITRYWRGPSWPITNLFLIDGLLSYQDERAQKEGKILLVRTCKMIEEFGFYEHYDPIHGLSPVFASQKEGMGFGEFSWSAAIYLYLSNQYQSLLV